MRFQIEVEREEDGRWIAEVPDLPGVMAYGSDRGTALANVRALALRVLTDGVENGDLPRNMVAEAMEEVALVRAIHHGEASDPVSRDEVFRALEVRG